MALTRFASGHSWGETVGTSILGMSLNYTVGAAVLKGLFTKHEPFKVTSKGKRKKAAKFPAMPEAILSGLLILACVTAIVLNHAGTMSLTLWTILLAVMAVPNIAASLLAATDLMPVREKAPETVVEPAGCRHRWRRSRRWSRRRRRYWSLTYSRSCSVKFT